MNFSNELIDEFKKAKGIKTDSEVAEMLPEMNKGNLSKIRKGTENRHLNETQAIYIAHECNLSVDWVLVQLAEETAKSEEAKNAWHNLAKKLNKSVLATILAVVVVFGGLNQNGEHNARFA